jgi:hypothetical protein
VGHAEEHLGVDDQSVIVSARSRSSACRVGPQAGGIGASLGVRLYLGMDSGRSLRDVSQMWRGSRASVAAQVPVKALNIAALAV